MMRRPVLVAMLWAAGTAGCLLAAGCAGQGNGVKDPPVPTAATQADVPVGEVYQVLFKTSKGPFVIEVHPEWAPRGAARFRELVEANFYEDCRFFRVMPEFMVQVGMNGTPSVNDQWQNNTFPDDPVVESNTPGTVSFATSGPDSRTTQFFINYADNTRSLDPQGFAPFGKVIEGMDVVKSINSEYREMPNQGMIGQRGNAYLNAQFPNLDYIVTARIVE